MVWDSRIKEELEFITDYIEYIDFFHFIEKYELGWSDFEDGQEEFITRWREELLEELGEYGYTIGED